MGNINFTRVYEDGIYDFREVILPNVWEELLVAESFDKYGLIIIGATDENGKALGAVVARLLEGYEIFLSSVYVLIENRREGIGTMLFDSLIQEAVQEFNPSLDDNSRLVSFMRAEYALLDKDMDVFHKFLERVGFTDFLEKPATYMFTKEDLKKIERNEEIKVLNMGEELGDGLYDFFSSFDLIVEPKYSFFTGTKADPRLMMLCELDDESNFFLTCNSIVSDATYDELEAVLYSFRSIIEEDYSDYTVLVNGEKNNNLEDWDRINKTCGVKASREEAGMYIEVE